MHSLALGTIPHTMARYMIRSSSMQFQSSQVIDFPIERVFFLVRDCLAELVPFLPNVKKIEVDSREEV